MLPAISKLLWLFVHLHYHTPTPYAPQAQLLYLFLNYKSPYPALFSGSSERLQLTSHLGVSAPGAWLVTQLGVTPVNSETDRTAPATCSTLHQGGFSKQPSASSKRMQHSCWKKKQAVPHCYFKDKHWKRRKRKEPETSGGRKCPSIWNAQII